MKTAPTAKALLLLVLFGAGVGGLLADFFAAPATAQSFPPPGGLRSVSVTSPLAGRGTPSSPLTCSGCGPHDGGVFASSYVLAGVLDAGTVVSPQVRAGAVDAGIIVLTGPLSVGGSNGTASQCLLSNGAGVAPAWGSCGGGGITGALTSGRVTLSSGASTVTDDAELTYNTTSNELTTGSLAVGTAGGRVTTGACSSGDVGLSLGGTTRFCALGDNFRPTFNNSYDLGTSAFLYRNLYVTDIGASGTRARTAYLSTSLNTDSTDSTGSPGAATINKPSGKSAIAASATSVVITNNTVSTTSRVFVQPTETDATCYAAGAANWIVTTAAGSFTVTPPAGCTAATNFDWFVVQ